MRAKSVLSAIAAIFLMQPVMAADGDDDSRLTQAVAGRTYCQTVIHRQLIGDPTVQATLGQLFVSVREAEFLPNGSFTSRELSNFRSRGDSARNVSFESRGTAKSRATYTQLGSRLYIVSDSGVRTWYVGEDGAVISGHDVDFSQFGDGDSARLVEVTLVETDADLYCGPGAESGPHPLTQAQNEQP